MRTDAPQAVLLEQYTPFPYSIQATYLDFQLEPETTIVRSRLTINRNVDVPAPLALDGEALKLVSISIDGRQLATEEYEAGETGLIIHEPPANFTLEIETEISPAKNTALSGLYMSGGRYCTQCEAEGFRRITYWPDRPDVLSVFTVRAHVTDDEAFPYILSNGNPVAIGETEGRGVWAEWHDPYPKPSYLFALCAGDYDVLSDKFTTMSGRTVALNIYVDKGDAERAHYAMDSLKRSMKWDEDVFAREYDLEVFNLVAVRDFNFGAMENKGLNIFNSAYVLADANTATDADFEAIESIVAHEYFHNWTGNRITCRDWFQLCLKEGLTVYRDQEFSADMRSRSVQRIKDVIRLRGRQFQEDSGPLAHSVRPSAYAKIDNLYTATVYEKGAELIRSLHALLGAEVFAKGIQIYFYRFDGIAATIEDFYSCFEEASGLDLSSFMVWYTQAGTPEVRANWTLNADNSMISLTLSQMTPVTPDQNNKSAVPIPLRIALIDNEGRAIPHQIAGTNEPQVESLFTLTETEQTVEVTFAAQEVTPLLSLNRSFSAPIKLIRENDTEASLIQRVALETDPFSQWDALQSLLTKTILKLAYGVQNGELPEAPADLIEAQAKAIENAVSSDPAFASLLLRLPNTSELFAEMKQADPQALFLARTLYGQHLLRRISETIDEIISAPVAAEFSVSAAAASVRALRSAAIELLAFEGQGQEGRLKVIYDASTNMTETMAVMRALSMSAGPVFDEAIADFEQKWKSSPLVMDKWFAVQSSSPHRTALARAKKLIEHPDFDWKTPNRVRSVAASFGMVNLVGFHAPDGEGYRFLVDVISKVDPLNSALSARLSTAFEQWKCLASPMKELAKEALETLQKKDLSDNARDIIARALQ